MILIALLVMWTQIATAIAFNASVQPADPIVLNGTDLTLNCTLGGRLGVRRAADVDWIACRFPMEGCGAVGDEHSVEAVGNRTSLLHLRGLAVDGENERKARIYRCCFDCDARPDLNTLTATTTTVLVGSPPHPVENLQCSSRDRETFSCVWEQGPYNSLSVKSTYVQYRQRIGNNDWSETRLNQSVMSFSAPTSMYEMEIRVAQENALGNSTVSMVYFSRNSDTIPNPPEGLEMSFQTGQLTWQLPRKWLPQFRSLLQYRVEFKSDKMTTSVAVDVRHFTVGAVEPYTNYTARVACKLSGAKHWSEWSSLLTATSPEAAPSGQVLNPRQSVLGTNQDAYKRDVQLTWQPPSMDRRNGVIRGYELYVVSSPLLERITLSVADGVYELKDIERFQRYIVGIAAYTIEGAVGPIAELTIPDLTTEPANVENVVVISEAPHQIVVTWDEPSNPQGVIERYTVKWRAVDSPGNVHTSELPDSTRRQFVIQGLLPYTEYNITVVVRNKRGDSDGVTLLGKTHFARPTLPRNLNDRKPSPTVIDLHWDPPESLNGPLLGYEVRYWLSGGDPSRGGGVNKSVTATQARLHVNCSTFEEAVPFTFQVSAATGRGQEDKLLGPPAQLEKEMCGPGSSITSIMMGILISAFSILCLVSCLCWASHSSLMKPTPDPHFADGILPKSSDRFTSRSPTRPEDKEYFDALKTVDSIAELGGPRLIAPSNKSSLSSSSGSSDQGFHDMHSDTDHYSAAAGGDHRRRPNGHLEPDVERGQTALSPTEEYREDEDPVCGCAEDRDDVGGPVVSYHTRTPSSLPASPAAVHVSMDSVQYTSRRESVSASGSPDPAHRLSSGSESGSLTYHRLGANRPPPSASPPKESTRPDPGEESDANYSQMAMHGAAVLARTPPYESVWPSVPTPPQKPASGGDGGGQDPKCINDFRTELGFNNNSKDIPDIHAADGAFRVPRDIIVATALSPQTRDAAVATPAATREVSPLLPKLSSTDSDDYIDFVGGGSSPRADASHISSPLMSPRSRTDAGCMDYVLQSELPPASPPDSSVL